MKIGKTKYLIGALVLGATGTTALWAYGQYKKLLKNVTGIKSFTLKNLSVKNIAFNVVATYQNNMDVNIKLTNQEYDIYLDGIYTTTLKNPNELIIKANALNEIPLDASFDPKELFKKLSTNPVNFLTNYKKIRVKIVMRLRVKLLFFNITVPYEYEDSLKNMAGLK